MKVISKTHVGMVRNNNEDSLLVREPFLFAVADGMGGHLAGDYASKHTIGFVHDFLANWEGEPENGFQFAAVAANRELLRRAVEDPTRDGMGTTLVMLSVYDDHYLALNVGDSRIYGLFDGKLTQISKDHSWVEEMLALGYIEKDSEIYHAKRNIITRAIGASPEIVPDLYRAEHQNTTSFLLCSDGLTNMMPDEKIGQILSGYFKEIFR